MADRKKTHTNKQKQRDVSAESVHSNLTPDPQPHIFRVSYTNGTGPVVVNMQFPNALRASTGASTCFLVCSDAFGNAGLG